MGGKIGVDIFVLISGYFLINSKGISLKKIFKYLGQVVFYSITIFALFNIFGITQFKIKNFIKALFPITFREYWFASTYFVLFLLHPFLNKFLHVIDKNLYQKLILLLIFCWSIIPTIMNSQYESNSLLWFITLYIIAGYIQLYGLNNKVKLKHYLILFIIFYTLTYFSTIILILLGTKVAFFANHINAFYEQNDFNIFLVSLTLFMVFVNLKMKYNKWINIIASASFGVYLIHDNNLVRPFLWETIFKNYLYQNSLLLIPYSIITVFLVYVVCTLIDLIRKLIFEKAYMRIINYCESNLIRIIKKLYYICQKFIFG